MRRQFLGLDVEDSVQDINLGSRRLFPEPRRVHPDVLCDFLCPVGAPLRRDVILRKQMLYLYRYPLISARAVDTALVVVELAAGVFGEAPATPNGLRQCHGQAAAVLGIHSSGFGVVEGLTGV